VLTTVALLILPPPWAWSRFPATDTFLSRATRSIEAFVVPSGRVIADDHDPQLPATHRDREPQSTDARARGSDRWLQFRGCAKETRTGL
jgi:hypothetical protein